MEDLWSREEVQILEERIKELEKKVEDLRIGRRILMNIVEIIEKRKEQEINELKIKNKKLKHDNIKYANLIIQSYRKANAIERKNS